MPTLNRLALAPECQLVAVVTQPDRRAGRGRKQIRPAVAQRADALELPVLQPDKARDPEFHVALGALAPDLAVVVAYGEIFPESLLEIPRLGFYNLHASILPRHRGPSPVSAAIMQGDRSSGVTFFQIVKRMDAGPVMAQREIPIGARETAGALHDRLCLEGAELVADCVGTLASGRNELVEQDESRATYCKLLTKRDGWIDWTAHSQEVDRQIRAMTPWPGPRTTLHCGRRQTTMTIIEAHPGSGDQSGAPGSIVTVERDSLCVATGGGGLVVRRLLPTGKRAMDVAEYLRGNPIGDGSRFE